MGMRKIIAAWLPALLIVFCVGPAMAEDAALQVMTSGGFAPPLKTILADFQKTTGMAVTVTIGKSQGAGDDTIAAQLARHVPADMVVLTREGLNDLIAQGRITPKSEIDIAKSPLGVAVRAGAPKPDISTVDAFKKTLLDARSIAYPGSTTGFYVSGTLYPKLGLAKELQAKSSNIGVTGVAAGKAEIAVQAITELVHAPGADYVGLVPKALQYDTVFSTALVKDTKNMVKARRLMAFFASKTAASVFKDSGMESIQPH
jgi:molybdate transport system substrate-binding protein